MAYRKKTVDELLAEYEGDELNDAPDLDVNTLLNGDLTSSIIDSADHHPPVSSAPMGIGAPVRRSSARRPPSMAASSVATSIPSVTTDSRPISSSSASVSTSASSATKSSFHHSKPDPPTSGPPPPTTSSIIGRSGFPRSADGTHSSYSSAMSSAKKTTEPTVEEILRSESVLAESSELTSPTALSGTMRIEDILANADSDSEDGDELDDLGDLSGLPGFGGKSAAQILRGDSMNSSDRQSILSDVTHPSSKKKMIKSDRKGHPRSSSKTKSDGRMSPSLGSSSDATASASAATAVSSSSRVTGKPRVSTLTVTDETETEMSVDEILRRDAERSISTSLSKPGKIRTDFAKKKAGVSSSSLSAAESGAPVTRESLMDELLSINASDIRDPLLREEIIMKQAAERCRRSVQNLQQPLTALLKKQRMNREQRRKSGMKGGSGVGSSSSSVSSSLGMTGDTGELDASLFKSTELKKLCESVESVRRSEKRDFLRQNRKFDERSPILNDMSQVTCVRSGEKFTAIGLSCGTVLIFDFFQSVKMKIPNTISGSPSKTAISKIVTISADGKSSTDLKSSTAVGGSSSGSSSGGSGGIPTVIQGELGKVSSLAFSHNESSLAVGYSSGVVSLWDISSGVSRLVKMVRDVSKHPIVFLNFYKRGQLRLLVGDCKGLVITLAFVKFMFRIQAERQIIFSGAKSGIIYDLALYEPNPQYPHVLDSFSLLTAANSQCVFFVTLDPLRILAPRLEHAAQEGCAPVVAWRERFLPPPKVVTSSSSSSAATAAAAFPSSSSPTPSTSSLVRGGTAASPSPDHPRPPASAVSSSSSSSGFLSRPAAPRAPVGRTPPPPMLADGSSLLPHSGPSMSMANGSVESVMNTALARHAMKRAFYQNPVLAVGVASRVQLFEVFCLDTDRLTDTRDTSLIKVKGMGELDIRELVMALKWLNDRLLVVLTARFEIFVLEGFPILKKSDLLTMKPLLIRTDKGSTKTFYPKFVAHLYFTDPLFGSRILPSYGASFEVSHGPGRTGEGNKLLVICTYSSMNVTYAVEFECMTYNDRVNALCDENEWEQALSLCIEFKRRFDKGKISPGPSVRRLLSRLDELVIEFSRYCFSSTVGSAARTFSAKGIGDDSYRRLEKFVSVTMDYLTSIGRLDFLFGEVYSMVAHSSPSASVMPGMSGGGFTTGLDGSVGREVFFQCLQPYLFAQRIQKLSPEMMDDLVRYLVTVNDESGSSSTTTTTTTITDEKKKSHRSSRQKVADVMERRKFAQLEQLILYLSPDSFDFEKMVKLSMERHFFKALCHLYIEGCYDFAKPLESCFEKFIRKLMGVSGTMNDFSQPSTLQLLNVGGGADERLEPAQNLGYQLLLYLKYVMNGFSFPWHRKLMRPTVAKQQLLKYLFMQDRKFRVLRFLTGLDLFHTLDCLKACFDDSSLFDFAITDRIGPDGMSIWDASRALSSSHPTQDLSSGGVSSDHHSVPSSTTLKLGASLSFDDLPPTVRRYLSSSSVPGSPGFSALQGGLTQGLSPMLGSIEEDESDGLGPLSLSSPDSRKRPERRTSMQIQELLSSAQSAATSRSKFTKKWIDGGEAEDYSMGSMLLDSSPDSVSAMDKGTKTMTTTTTMSISEDKSAKRTRFGSVAVSQKQRMRDEERLKTEPLLEQLYGADDRSGSAGGGRTGVGSIAAEGRTFTSHASSTNPMIKADYKKSSEILTPTQQEMINALVKVLFGERPSEVIKHIHSEEQHGEYADFQGMRKPIGLPSLSKANLTTFLYFCTSYVISGVCNLPSVLLHELILTQLRLAVRLSRRMSDANAALKKVSDELNELESQRKIFDDGSPSAMLTSPTVMRAEHVSSLSLIDRSSGPMDLASLERKIHKASQQRRRLSEKLNHVAEYKQHTENCVLVLLSRHTAESERTAHIRRASTIASKAKLSPEQAKKQDQMLQLAKEASLFRVSLYLFKQENDHASAIDAHINDNEMSDNVFDYIHNLFTDIKEDGERQLITPETKQQLFIELVGVIQKRLPKLVEIDPCKTAIWSFTWLPQRFDICVSALRDSKSDRQLYKLLNCVADAIHRTSSDSRRGAGSSSGSASDNKSLIAAAPEGSQSLRQRYESNSDMLTIQEKALGKLISELKYMFTAGEHELFIRLLCEFEKKRVLPYLKENPDRYTMEKVQRACTRHNVSDALAYLQERSGDIEGALEYYIESMKHCIQQLWEEFDQSEMLLGGEVKSSGSSSSMSHSHSHSHSYSSSSMKTPRSSHARSTLVNPIPVFATVSLRELSETVPAAADALKQLGSAVALCRRHSLQEQVTEQQQQSSSSSSSSSTSMKLGKGRLGLVKGRQATSTAAARMAGRNPDEELLEHERLWDVLLDACLTIEQNVAFDCETETVGIKYSTRIRHAMKSCTHDLVTETLEAMMGFGVNLARMFTKVVSSSSKSKFRDHQSTIDVMFSTYRYEFNMLRSAVQLFRRGAFDEYCTMIRQSGRTERAVDGHSGECRLCEERLCSMPVLARRMADGLSADSGVYDLRSFTQCSHTFHSLCLSMPPLHFSGGIDESCPLCSDESRDLFRKAQESLSEMKRREAKEALESFSAHKSRKNGSTLPIYLAKLKEVGRRMHQKESARITHGSAGLHLSTEPANSGLILSRKAGSLHCEGGASADMRTALETVPVARLQLF